MDIYCKRCGEPWDAYGARQYMDMTKEEYDRMMCGEGCPCCFGKEVKERPFRAQVTSALHDILGDDLDGLASELQDAEYMMGKEFWK